MTDNEDLWCKQIRKFEDHTFLNYYSFLDDVSVSGVHLEECLVPCKTKKYSAKKVNVAKQNTWNQLNLKGIFIWFEEDVKISKSSLKFDAEKMYSTVGGIMGTSRSFVWLIVLLMSSVGVILARFNVSSVISWCTLSTI